MCIHSDKYYCSGNPLSVPHQIAYARDAIVNSLGGLALAVQESEEAKNDSGASVEITGIIPPSPDIGTGLAGSLGLGVKCKGSEVAVKKPMYIPGKEYDSLLLFRGLFKRHHFSLLPSP